MRKFIYGILLWLVLMPMASVQADGEPEDAKKKSNARRVAVMRFINRTGKDDLNRACSLVPRLLISDLGVTPGVIVLERERLADMLKEIELGSDGFLDPATAPKAGHAIDAEFLVEGQLSLADKTLKFKFHIFSLSQNKKVFENTVEGGVNELHKIEAEILKQVIKEIKPEAVKAEKVDVPAHIKLAIMPFEDLTPEGKIESLCAVMPDLLYSDFASFPQISCLSREHLDEILKEQEMTISGLTEKKNALKVSKIAGLDYIVLGSVSLVGSEIRFDIRVVKVESGDLLFSATSSGNIKDMMKVQGALSEKMLQEFKTGLFKLGRQNADPTQNASKEALYHLSDALKMGMDTRTFVGSDEKEAIQRVLFLDSLDTSAELFIIDKLMEIDMLGDAEKRIRKALSRKLAPAFQAALWLRLAETYNPKGRAAILWYLVKEFPDSREALIAYWNLGHLYCQNAACIKDQRIAAKCFEALVKREKELPGIEWDVTRFSNSRGPMMAFVEYPRWRLQEIKKLISDTDRNIDYADPADIVDDMVTDLKSRKQPVEFDIEQVKKDIGEYISAINEKKHDDAFEALKKFACHDLASKKVSDMCNVLFDRFRGAAEYDKAIALRKWQIKAFTVNPVGKSSDMKKIVDYLEYLAKCVVPPAEFWKECDPEKYKLPDYNSDRETLSPFLYRRVYSWHEICTREAVEACPDSPEKAYKKALELVKASEMPRNKYGKTPSREEGMLLQAENLLAIYCASNKHNFAMKVLNEYIKGDTLEEKIKGLSKNLCKLLGDHFAKRLDFGKALKFYEKGDKAGRIEILMFKLRDFETAVKELPVNMEGEFSPFPVDCAALAPVGRFPSGRFGFIDDEEGRLQYLAARCMEEQGDFRKAHMLFYRYVHGRGMLPIANKKMVEDAKKRMRNIEDALKQKMEKAVSWKPGTWWEGVQGWYMESPPGKKMQSGWVFTDLYFVVDEIANIRDANNYVVHVYHCSRETYLKEMAGVAENDENGKEDIRKKLHFVTFLVQCASLSPSAMQYNPSRDYLQDVKFGEMREGNTPRDWAYDQKSLFTGYTILTVAENKFMPPPASVIFGEPFMPAPYKWMADKIKYSDDAVMINGKKTQCRRLLFECNTDIDLTGFATNRENDENKRIEILKNYPNMYYNCQQWWVDGYPWWVRTAIMNRNYVEGKSPDHAKYSKIFVMTNFNGNEVKVDTGLPGKMADIKEMRKSFENFEKNCPYSKYPSMEGVMAVNHCLLNPFSDNCQSSVITFFKMRAEIICPFLVEKYKELGDGDDDKIRIKCLTLIGPVLGDSDAIKLVDERLAKIDAKDSDLFIRYMNMLWSDESFKEINKAEIGALFTRHFNRFEENSSDKSALYKLMETMSWRGHYSMIPFYLEKYRATKDVQLLNYASNITRTTYSRDIIFLTPQSSQENIDKTITRLEQWYKTNLERDKK